MGQVKNNDSFLGKAEKLKPVLKHRMLRPVGVVSFERKKADSGADFWNTVGIERLGILSVMLSDEPLAYRWDCHPTFRLILGWGQTLTNYVYNNIKIAYEICKTWIFNTKKRARSISLSDALLTEAGVMLLLLVLLFENYFSKIINQFLTTAQ